MVFILSVLIYTGIRIFYGAESNTTTYTCLYSHTSYSYIADHMFGLSSADTSAILFLSKLRRKNKYRSTLDEYWYTTWYVRI